MSDENVRRRVTRLSEAREAVAAMRITRVAANNVAETALPGGGATG